VRSIAGAAIPFLLATILAALFGVLIWQDTAELTLFPLGLLLVYFAIYQTEKVFISLAFLTPLSVNIEEFTQSFGLFIPTEPLLFGLMLLLVAAEIKTPFLNKEIWKSPIIHAVLFYLLVVIITAITSSHPMVSFKFLLARLWFIIPVLIFGTHFFQKENNRMQFLWLFVIATCIAILYSLAHHSMYGFGEKEGHWVMWPLFKDHTIYGAIVALVLPIVIALYFSEKHNPLTQAILITLILIVLVGLYYSYTRAAWLSVICAAIVCLTVYYRVNFKILAGISVVALIVVFFKWDQIQMELGRNKYEHTTESFDERLQSATNVTTDASNLERINRWSCAIAMFEQRPIFGYGPGTYAFEYAPFQEPENLTIISTNFGDMGNAHREYLAALSEMGVMGLVSFIGIVVAIFFSMITLYNKLPLSETKNRVLVMGMIAATTTYFVHAFLNNFLDTDKAAVPIWAMCAMVIVMGMQLNSKENTVISK
jgi:O-antigen ligase